MIMKILTGIIIVVAVLVMLIAMRPDQFSVERSAVIDGSVPIVFEHVNDLHKWNAWSPWARLDPAAKITFDGPVAGKGASMAWASSNNEVGEGQMTITDSRFNEFIEFKLDFQKPMQGTSNAKFTFAPANGKTLVTWSMFGHAGFMQKAIGLFMNCDKMVGDQFQSGLSNLNAIVSGAKS